MITALTTDRRLRIVGAATAALGLVGLAGCTPSTGASSTPASTPVSSSAPAPSPSEPAQTESTTESTAAEPGSGMPDGLAESAMPPKNWDAAPTFPKNFPDKIGEWEAFGPVHSDLGTTASYTKGTDVATVTWGYEDFGAYSVDVDSMTGAKYVGDFVCGTDSAGSPACLVAAKNGVLNVGGIDLSVEQVAEITKEIVAGVAS